MTIETEEERFERLLGRTPELPTGFNEHLRSLILDVQAVKSQSEKNDSRAILRAKSRGLNVPETSSLTTAALSKALRLLTEVAEILNPDPDRSRTASEDDRHEP